MRDLILFVDLTVDGFMAGPNNDLSVMVEDEDLHRTTTAEMMERADTIIVGRKTFLDMATYWPTAPGPLAQWMNATPKVVLSNTLKDGSAWQNATVASDDAVAEAQRLKALPGKALVVFGGVQTVRSLVRAGLVDEFWLKVSPVVVGQGGPVFADLSAPMSLKLQSVRSFPSGVVALIYKKPVADSQTQS